MPVTIIILIILICFSAFFSASETAIISLSDAKIRSLVHKEVHGAKDLHALRKNAHKLLITILIGNNLVNISASVIAADLFTKLFGSAGLGIATGVMTFFILVFGEISPKSFATRYSTQIALFSAKPVLIIQIIFTPFIWFLDKIVKQLIDRLGGKMHEEKVSEEEIKAFIDISAEAGTIEKRERELLKNVLQFNDIEVEEVMTPRVSIDALPFDSTLQQVMDFVIQKSRSRVPIYKDTIDNIIGIITIKDVLSLLKEYNINKKIENIELKQPLMVPVSKKIDSLFKEFQKARMHIAVVIDEYGGTAGIVTLEDLLEEIFGEIVDEADVEEVQIIDVNENEIIVYGTTRLDTINAHLGIKLKGDEMEPINALILDNLHRFPVEGEKIQFPQATIEVLKMNRNKILRVKVTK